MLAVLIFTLSGCVVEPGPVEFDAAAVRGDVLLMLADYQTAIQSGDPDAIRARYIADDRFSWSEDGRVQYQTVDAVLAALAKLPADTEIKTEYIEVEVHALSADHATIRTGFQTDMTLPGGNAYVFGGVITMVVEREDDGWRVVSGHTSTASARGDWE